jgi:hypothetical protein
LTRHFRKSGLLVFQCLTDRHQQERNIHIETETRGNEVTRKCFFIQHATFYTDQYVVYAGVIPAAQHRAISKLARKTNHIERFNNTLR